MLICTFRLSAVHYLCYFTPPYLFISKQKYENIRKSTTSCRQFLPHTHRSHEIFHCKLLGVDMLPVWHSSYTFVYMVYKC